MIKWMSKLIDRLSVVIGAFIFSQAPIFMQQYRHQLSGHVSELQLQVQNMRQIAMTSNKTLDQYIQKFVSSSDPDFSRQGEVMASMVTRWHELQDGLLAVDQASVLMRPFSFIRHIDLAIAKSTLHSFEFGVAFTYESLVYILFGMSVGYLSFLVCRKAFRLVLHNLAPAPTLNFTADERR